MIYAECFIKTPSCKKLYTALYNYRNKNTTTIAPHYECSDGGIPPLAPLLEERGNNYHLLRIQPVIYCMFIPTSGVMLIWWSNPYLPFPRHGRVYETRYVESNNAMARFLPSSPLHEMCESLCSSPGESLSIFGDP
jgi:hypothetical protein